MKSLVDYIKESKSYSNQEIFNAKKHLEKHIKDFDLEGCEISDEDATNMLDLIGKGKSKEEATEEILNGIRSTLD